MKHIEKGAEPPSLAEWRQQCVGSPSWEDLQSPAKRDIHRVLVAEQGCLCCYCCCRITGWNDSDIEHFRPRSDPQFRDRVFDYANLLCSCVSRSFDRANHRCGARKGDWFNEDLLANPLDKGVELLFRFTADGHIHPTDGDEKLATRAAATIKNLNLDCPLIVAGREAAIDTAFGDQLLNTDAEAWCHRYLEVDVDGQFAEYWCAIWYRSST